MGTEPTDDAIAAAGKMTEALETLERARGHLYSFHQLVGEADLKLDEVLAALGPSPLADALERELVGRDVLPGRWTFQVVEEFDDGYYASFREQERRIREALIPGGARHLHEARMKDRRHTSGHPAHSEAPRQA